MLCHRKICVLFLLLYLASICFGNKLRQSRLRLTRRRQFVVRCCSGRTSCYSNLGRISSTATTDKNTIVTTVTESASDSEITDTDAAPQANVDATSAPVANVKMTTIASNTVLVTSLITAANPAATTIKIATIANMASNSQIINGGALTTQGSANIALTNNNLDSTLKINTINPMNAVDVSTSSNAGASTSSSNSATNINSNSNTNSNLNSNPNSLATSNPNSPANSNSASTANTNSMTSNSNLNNVPTPNPNSLSTSNPNSLTAAGTTSSSNSNTQTASTINTATTTVTTRCPSACTEESCLSANDTKQTALNQIASTTAYPGNFNLNYISGSYYYFDNTTQVNGIKMENSASLIWYIPQLSWYDALAFCKSIGMKLVSIETQAEQNAINTFFQSKGLGNKWIFISGNKIGSQCKYSWENGQAITYNNWNTGYPANEDTDECMVLVQGKWRDLTCSAITYFMCQQIGGQTITISTTTTTPAPTTTPCPYSLCVTASCNSDVGAKDAAIKAVPATTLSPTKLSLTYLNGGYYYFESVTKKTWFEALTFCRMNGMDLVSIQSQAEQDAINAKLTQLGIIDNYVFTSGNKIGPKCPYTWVDGSPLTYTYWQPGEPSQSIDENCHITWKSKWWDLPCSYTAYFICEQLPGWSTTTTTSTTTSTTTTTTSTTSTTTTTTKPTTTLTTTSTSTTTSCPYVNCTTTNCNNDIAAKDAAIKAVPATTLYPATLSLNYLNGKYYYFGIDAKTTWFNALTFCRKHGMDLVSIQSQAEQDAVNGQLVKLGLNGSYVFTSGNKIGPICPYTWVDGSPLSYIYWEIGQPSQASTENCLILLRNKWYDLGCSGAGYFVCEQLAGATITTTTTPCPYSNCTSADCNADVALKQDALAVNVAPSIGSNLQVVALNGRKYYIDPTKKMNYFDSIKFCRANGMDLAMIQSDAEQTAITDYLRSIGLENSPMYLSGNKIGPICPFTWLNGSPITYQNWNPGPPVEPSQSTTENCMCMWKRFWWDIPCNGTEHFLCEEL